MRKINWPHHIENQKRSHLKVSEYCRQHQLKAASFYAERRKHAARAQFIPVVVREEEKRPLLELILSSPVGDVVEFKGTTKHPELLAALLLGVAR